MTKARWLLPRLSLLIPALLGIAMAITHTEVNEGPGETGRAALTLLHEGFLGNPYLLPSGPTAHVSPVHTAYLATVFRLFGENTALARVVLSLVCVALWIGSAWLVLRMAERLRLGAAGLWSITLLTALCPVLLPESVIHMRQWDQPFAAFLLTCSLFVVLRGNQAGSLGPVTIAAMLAGLGGLISPALLPSLLIGTVYLLPPIRHRRRFMAAGLLSLAVVAAFLLPWGLRNSRELGVFTMTRSNFALELAVGNNDAATGTPAMAAQIHPFESESAARLAAELGEVRFMQRMREQAVAWITAHPLRFAELSITRGVLLLLPRQEMVVWRPFIPVGLAWAFLLAYGAAKLLATFFVLLRGSRRILWLTYTMLPLAPYVLTHVSTRYAFVVFFPSACLIGLVADHLWRLATNRVPETQATSPEITAP